MGGCSHGVQSKLNLTIHLESPLIVVQLYHSIHVRGERVEDVIKAAESEGDEMDMATDSLVGVTSKALANGVLPEELEDGELEDDAPSGEPPTNGGFHSEEHVRYYQYSFPLDWLTFSFPQVASGPTLEHTQNEPSEMPNTSGMPAAIMDAVKDDGLKNLMMSWYYAGYYTGLYEGEQKALDTQTKR